MGKNFKIFIECKSCKILVKSLGDKRKNRPQKKQKEVFQISSIENQLIEKLGTKVTIRNTKREVPSKSLIFR